jgi:hypothetical protein
MKLWRVTSVKVKSFAMEKLNSIVWLQTRIVPFRYLLLLGISMYYKTSINGVISRTYSKAN